MREAGSAVARIAAAAAVNAGKAGHVKAWPAFAVLWELCGALGREPMGSDLVGDSAVSMMHSGGFQEDSYNC